MIISLSSIPSLLKFKKESIKIKIIIVNDKIIVFFFIIIMELYIFKKIKTTGLKPRCVFLLIYIVINKQCCWNDNTEPSSEGHCLHSEFQNGGVLRHLIQYPPYNL